MRAAQLVAIVATAILSASIMIGQAQTGVFFTEGWESGNASGSFNSSANGRATGSQFSVQNTVVASGNWALRHVIPPNTPVGNIQFATQHFGDARTGPLAAGTQGQTFPDLYVQYRIYYGPGYDFRGYTNKQVIVGTEDSRRHDDPCCNPWVAHYLTIYPPGRTLLAEANNKQAASGQWVGFGQNSSGYSNSNLMTMTTGRWYTVEIRRRLNDAGVDNGIFQQWVDGVLISDYRNVRYRIAWNGSYGSDMNVGTNFVMISDYGGTYPNAQTIYWDDFKFSPLRIGAGSAPTAPTNLRVTVP